MASTMAMCQTVTLEWPHPQQLQLQQPFITMATARSRLAVMVPIVACAAIGGSERFWNMFQNGCRTTRLRI
jgi:hypothetical protein